jgi:UDP:flavonoid glycosyltransferase YjiC (YdhE family)
MYHACRAEHRSGVAQRGRAAGGVPIANDQPAVGARLAWSGAGQILPLARLSPARLGDAMERVLHGNESYQRSAQRLQAAIAQSGGASQAADIVEQAITTGRPVLCCSEGQ